MPRPHGDYFSLFPGSVPQLHRAWPIRDVRQYLGMVPDTILILVRQGSRARL